MFRNRVLMENASVIARSLAVEVPASVNMGGSAERARSLAVEADASVLMENARNGARSLQPTILDVLN